MSAFNTGGSAVVLVALIITLALAVVASLPRTPHRTGLHWVIVPVAVIIATAIIGAATTATLLPDEAGFRTAVSVLLLLIGVVGGSPLVVVVLHLAGSGTTPLGEHGGILVSEDGKRTSSREILRGGMTIGYLERLAIGCAALLGQYAAVAIVVAVKGLGRYSELENAAARERFIIGTLVSFVWVAACAAPAIIAWG